MCCPYFEPAIRLGEGPWDPAPRLPLIDAWQGLCTLGGSVPEETEQREVCNTGYARGRCSRFPENAEADAVRFSAGSDNRIIWVLEKDHAPLRFGNYPQEDLASTLQAQARAYLE